MRCPYCHFSFLFRSFPVMWLLLRRHRHSLRPIRRKSHLIRSLKRCFPDRDHTPWLFPRQREVIGSMAATTTHHSTLRVTPFSPKLGRSRSLKPSRGRKLLEHTGNTSMDGWVNFFRKEIEKSSNPSLLPLATLWRRENSCRSSWRKVKSNRQWLLKISRVVWCI